MGLNIANKKEVVAEVSKVASEAYSLVATEYHGLTVEQMTQLRAKARDNGVYLRVVKNTLARRALSEGEFKCVKERLVGPLILAFSLEYPGAAPRLWRDFFKENDKIDRGIVKFVSVSGELLEGKEFERLAKLPSRDEGLALLMSCMLAPISKLVRTIDAVRQAKEA
ncbi:MAG: 50S ribosomal protein L10 [Candidatus Saccharibacteria bacterium]|nr:50S ribosomal protein L10 [Candidatus Saccharibacteria bacterium]